MTKGIPDTTESDSEEVPTFEITPMDDDPRKDVLGMYDDLVDQFGEAAIEQMVGEELSAQAAKVIEFLYSNQDNLEQE